jgi:tRNA threonylcarbamoyladenosine biosynthesis protein TsaB
MLVLTIRTDKPVAEIGLFEYTNNIDSVNKIEYYEWEAHKILSETLLTKIKQILNNNNLNYKDIGGLVCFQGPGSFTGLRIGISIANSLSFGLNIPIVASNEENWIQTGIGNLDAKKEIQPIVPFYGSPVHITKAKK